MKSIQLLDLPTEYLHFQSEIDTAIHAVLRSGDYIQGKSVQEFEASFAKYLGEDVDVVGVGNGTDALQIALLALGLQRGDEVIVPSFTYFASAEAIAFLGFTPVFVDVDVDTFTINADAVENAITQRTKAVIAVHIYGKAVKMNPLISVAKKHNIFIIEDVAQAIGGETEIDGKPVKLGTIGDIGCVSFFPSKNLGCFGDGGAVISRNNGLLAKARMIANHGQSSKYVHDIIGMNSRLDGVQAAILHVKLKYLDTNNLKRQEIARYYTRAFEGIPAIISPIGEEKNDHVYHQYTIRLADHTDRVKLQLHLKALDIPTRIYYPVPVHQQKAMNGVGRVSGDSENTDLLTKSILSLPIHPELDTEQLAFIVQAVRSYFS